MLAPEKQLYKMHVVRGGKSYCPAPAGRPLPPLFDWQAGELDDERDEVLSVLLSHSGAPSRN